MEISYNDVFIIVKTFDRLELEELKMAIEDLLEEDDHKKSMQKKIKSMQNMNKQINFRRHGDVNMFPITEEEFNAIKGKTINHNGSHILARGEATGSVHELKVIHPQNLVIKEGEDGRMYFALNESATITHTHDHETITTPKKVFYRQIQERELNHFAESIERKVLD